MLALSKKRLIIGSLLALAGAGLSSWAGVSWARSALEDKLSERLKLPVTFGEIDLGYDVHEVNNVQVGMQAEGVRVQIRSVEVHGPLPALLLSGRSALREVHLNHLVVDVDADQLSKLPNPWGGKRTAAPDAVVPDMVERSAGPLQGGVSGLLIRLHDQDGALGQFQARRVKKVGGEISLSGGEGRWDDAQASVLASGLSVKLVHGPMGYRVHGGALEQLEVTGQALALPRGRRAMALLAQWLSGRGEKAAPGAAPPDSSTGEEEAGPDPQASRAPSKRGLEGASWARWLAPGAEVTVADVGVRLGAPGEEESLLREADIRITSPAQGSLTCVGSGRAATGGRIAWDALLSASPVSVRADLDAEDLPLQWVSGLVPQLPWYKPEDGRLSAKLRLRTLAAGHVSWDGELRLNGIGLASPRVAPEPVRGIGGALVGKGDLQISERRLQIDEGLLRLGDATLELQGAIAVSQEAYKVALNAKLPSTRCDVAMTAIPGGLLGDLSDMRLRGHIDGKVRLHLDSTALDDTVLDINVRDRCEFLRMPAVADLRRFRMPFKHSVVEPDESVFQMDTGPGTENFTYLEDISPLFVHAVLAHEDGRFFEHGGFSPFHIRNALVRNLKEGRYVVGASTISMQLVKNLLLHREKTLARKLQEVILTWYVERVMDKREILELYLNVIEYGPSVYGIRHAAHHYFKRLPSDLSPAEAAFFATILPSPKRFHDNFERGALSKTVSNRMKYLLRRLGERESYDEAGVAYGLAEVDSFRFVQEGAVATPRVVAGTSQPLPYQANFWDTGGWELVPTSQALGQ